MAATWAAGGLAIGHGAPPPRPVLRPPREMPRRRALGTAGARVALLHALVHIELNAIDLAWDLVARFAGAGLPAEFFDDWAAIAGEEALHFLLLSRRLQEYGAAYGDLPAHDGLWEAASATAGDLLARLAVVPLVLEARGLDVTPQIAARLAACGDRESALVLRRILRDEIGHVAAGRRWFERLCAARGLAPAAAFRDRVAGYFRGELKPPFNRAAREAAGLPASWYEVTARDLRQAPAGGAVRAAPLRRRRAGDRPPR